MQTTYIKKSSGISHLYFEGCMYFIRDDLYTKMYRIIWLFHSRVNLIQPTKQLEKTFNIFNCEQRTKCTVQLHHCGKFFKYIFCTWYWSGRSKFLKLTQALYHQYFDALNSTHQYPRWVCIHVHYLHVEHLFKFRNHFPNPKVS